MGPFQINQISLMIVGIVMVIPILMIVANSFIRLNAIKWINIIAGILYTFVSIGNINSEKWAYNLIYGIIEIIITLLIIIKSIKWYRKK
jgi:uncharacterized membrane protein